MEKVLNVFGLCEVKAMSSRGCLNAKEVMKMAKVFNGKGGVQALDKG